MNRCEECKYSRRNEKNRDYDCLYANFPETAECKADFKKSETGYQAE